MTKSKSVRLSKKGQFVLPKAMRDALGVKDGDALLATLEDGRVVLSRPAQFGKATRGLLRGAWGQTEQEVARHLDSERNSWP